MIVMLCWCGMLLHLFAYPVSFQDSLKINMKLKNVIMGDFVGTSLQKSNGTNGQPRPKDHHCKTKRWRKCLYKNVWPQNCWCWVSGSLEYVHATLDYKIRSRDFLKGTVWKLDYKKKKYEDILQVYYVSSTMAFYDSPLIFFFFLPWSL